MHFPLLNISEMSWSNNDLEAYLLADEFIYTDNKVFWNTFIRDKSFCDCQGNLYVGFGAKAIHKRKGLKKSQQILDHMGSTELAANLFRATQTEEKLKREQIKGKAKANKTHYEVGKKVRQTIKEIGGTMPEDLPVASSIKKLERKEQKKLKDLEKEKTK